VTLHFENVGALQPSRLVPRLKTLEANSSLK
jgi:hypothetical protein